MRHIWEWYCDKGIKLTKSHCHLAATKSGHGCMSASSRNKFHGYHWNCAHCHSIIWHQGGNFFFFLLKRLSPNVVIFVVVVVVLFCFVCFFLFFCCCFFFFFFFGGGGGGAERLSCVAKRVVHAIDFKQSISLKQADFNIFIDLYISNRIIRRRLVSMAWASVAYRQVSNIRRTESQHLKDYRTVLRLSLPNPLKPDVKSRMKM